MSLIRTRAEEDAADLILKQSTSPSPTPQPTPAPETPATPSASAAMDSMWSEYEQYLEAARAAQEAGIDIFPQPAFVVKVSLVNNGKKGQATRARKDLLEDDEKGDSESDKLFINVCTDACVDAPSIVKQSNDVPQPATSTSSALTSASSSAPATPPPGSLRLPMSVGPLTPCTSRSGAPSVCVDVVIHPSTLAPPLDASHSQAAYQYAIAQAALIQRQTGTQLEILTPPQQQAAAMHQLKRTIATFALQRVEEKYGLRVDGAAEVKFPRVVYKGSLPVAAQRIRRDKGNPLHAMTPVQREEAERKGKVMVQEVTQPQQSKPAATTTSSKAAVKVAPAPSVEPAQAEPAKQPSEHSSKERQGVEQERAVGEEAEQTKPEVSVVEQSTTEAEQPVKASENVVATPDYTLNVDDSQLTLQVQFPGVTSSAEVDATVTSTDIRITTEATDSRPAFQLHVVFPAPVDDERVQAKFNKKKNYITLTIPTLHQSPPQPATADAANNATPTAAQPAPAETSTEAVAHTAPAVSTAMEGDVGGEERGGVDREQEVDGGVESETLGGCGMVAAVDWAARLGLSNRLIDQSCLSYN